MIFGQITCSVVDACDDVDNVACAVVFDVSDVGSEAVCDATVSLPLLLGQTGQTLLEQY